jgi:hypothetical protein
MPLFLKANMLLVVVFFMIRRTHHLDRHSFVQNNNIYHFGIVILYEITGWTMKGPFSRPFVYWWDLLISFSCRFDFTGTCDGVHQDKQLTFWQHQLIPFLSKKVSEIEGTIISTHWLKCLRIWYSFSTMEISVAGIKVSFSLAFLCHFSTAIVGV